MGLFEHRYLLQALISKLSIAPMIDWTTTHFRVFMRLLAPNALLYTDMQTPGAIQHHQKRVLDHHVMEHPLALQLGGADKRELVKCAMLAEDLGFSEVNLNLGCPSDKVLAGRFGACLMAEPKHVADCISAMKEAVTIPITAKTRIGIDEQDSYEFFASFVQHLVDAGCDKLIVHARKAWLKGLSPKQNRTIPPLHYDYVYRIKEKYPKMPVVLNGQVLNHLEVLQHLTQVDGVMLGRLACQNPYQIAEIHHTLFPHCPLIARVRVLESYLDYAEPKLKEGVPKSVLLKPIFNLAHGLKGSKLWKQALMSFQQGMGELHLIRGISHQILVN